MSYNRMNTRLLDDEEIYSDAELRAKRRRAGFFLRVKDEEIELERDYVRNNVCPVHHLVLTTTGCCPRCSYKVPR